MLKAIFIVVAAMVVAIVIARVTFRLPSLADRPASSATKTATSGPLLKPVAHLLEEHPDKSGVYALSSGLDAFGARGLLAREAAQSLDVQYYIWHGDLTGLLLLESLREAAERGVTVRLLLDDNGISGLDPILSELNMHPHIEVRLYNPFTLRKFKMAGFLFDFLRLNRRMHNKSFTADGLATIVGGRNIGDEYFDTGSQPMFLDLDVLAIGKVVRDVSADFEKYWSSASAYPLEFIITESVTGGDELDHALWEISKSAQYDTYKKRLSASAVVNDLEAGTLPLEWTEVRLISDSPLKTLGKAKSDQMLIGKIDKLMDDVHSSIDVISPYFVPGKQGVEEFAALEKKGVEVRVLTNSMSANDVKLVHSGYAKYREKMLKAGAELFELKAQHSPPDNSRDAGIAGSSGSSLHAKTFATDEERIYIGSFNFDPRSMQLNTEMGFLIESKTMARQLKYGFDETLEDIAYRLELDDNHQIEWLDRSASGDAQRLDVDPETTRAERIVVKLLGYLPIQWLL
ncbi:Phospholipase D [Parasphingorhabdus sp. NYA22]